MVRRPKQVALWNLGGRMNELDAEHEQASKRMWLLGDVHAKLKHLSRALLDAVEKPNSLIFLGDIDIRQKIFSEIVEPLKRKSPMVCVTFICGNHDVDTYEHWAILADYGDVMALYGKVLDLDGVRVAGLDGNIEAKFFFQGTMLLTSALERLCIPFISIKISAPPKQNWPSNLLSQVRLSSYGRIRKTSSSLPDGNCTKTY